MTSDPSPSVSATDIAIVGMAAHLPGAPDVRQYWQNLRQGVESMQDCSEAELLAAGVPLATIQRAEYVRRAVKLEGLDQFDAGFFGYSPKDAAITDPQHRHFLEVCWEALEDAGHTPEGFGRPIGVFAGSGMTAYLTFNLLSNQQLVDDVGLFLLRHTGNDKDFLTTRVSYIFDLRGPSVNVQTACSTSLVAVHLAAQSLLSGECDMALAGGVTILLPHGRGYVFHENEILSPDGYCRPFDQSSRGTVFGSGAGVVVLRRLEDALADGDHVYAVIKGSAINNDGALKVGYLAPSVDGQAHAVAEALSVAGVDADSISYIEAHGTATPVGDPIEVAALTQAFRAGTQRKNFCGLGSVKSNIGHLDTAAGVAGLIKVAMALEQRELPPSLNFTAPNPQIDFAASPFYVNAKLQPWKSADGPRRAAVNSLGVGGTNAFVIVEEASRQQSGAASRPVQLLCLSARSSAALDAATERLRAHLQAQSDSLADLPLADVAWTLQSGRKAFAFRRTLAVRSSADACALLARGDRERVWTHKVSGREPSLVFLLSGGGAQYPGMGRDLHAQEPVYRAELERCLALMGPQLGPVVRRLLLSVPATPEAQAETARELTLPWFQLPALFATEYALARMWMSFGLEPAAMLGHSMGENTAACLAGVMSLEDAMGLVALRGELLKQVEPGGMLSVGLSPENLAPFLGDELVLAVVNAPELCVASGPKAAIDALEKSLREREIDCTRIHIDVAGHSPMFDRVLPAFGAYLRRIKLSPPKIPFVSNRTGTWITDAQATDPEYWVGHLRHAVLFSQGVRTLLADGGAQVFLEVGPGNTLASLTRLHGDASLARSIHSSLRHRDEKIDDLDFALSQLGKLWCAGARPDWRALHGGDRRLRVPLPTYPFERQRFWIEPGRTAAVSSDAPGALERLPDLANWFHVPVWKSAELPAASAPSGALRWLVFEDEGGLGVAFVALLRSQGHAVVSVREGSRFERLSDNEYLISPQEREDYTTLFEELTARGELPQRIVHLWMVTATEDTAVTTTFFHWVQERGFYSLLFLGQALANATLPGALHMAVVSNGMQKVGDELLRHPVKAAVLGACKVIPREIAELTCTSIDVDWPDASRNGAPTNGAHLATLCTHLGVEIANVPSNGVVAWRAGRRFEHSFEAAPLPALAAGRTAAREGATYLITGGLGGIGLAVAGQFARTARVKLVLLGRQPLPARAEWSAWLAAHGELDSTSRRLRQLMELEASGAEVMVASADVANIEELRLVLTDARARFGAIHGVIHAAGVVEDSVLSTKTPAAVDRVFTPKVHGTLLLDQLLSSEPLDFFVVFSSTSAWLGPAGQIDYAAANAFLDAFAVHRSARPGARTIAVGWGVWSEVGMAARLVQPTPSTPRAPVSARDGAAQHPLLGRSIVDGPAEIAWTAEYSPRTHWILSEHRLADGTALVPGTGYIEIARAALSRSELSRKGGGVELRDLSFVAPLAVADDETRAVLVRLRAEDGSWSFEVSSRAADAPSGSGWQVHAQGHAAHLDAAPAKRLALSDVAARCGTLANDALQRQNKNLRFGPRWDVVRELRFGDGEALARLELPEPWRGDQEQFQLHPALLDLATGFALRLIPDAGGDVFWAPLSYRRVRVHAALPARVWSHARRSARKPATGQRAASERPTSAVGDVALFDVTLCDENGVVLLEVEEFALRRFESSAALATGAPRAAAGRTVRADTGGGLVHVDDTLRRLVEQGIRPHEGCEALERVLASGRSGAIAVSSLDLGVLTSTIDAHSAQETSAPSAQFARPELATDYVAPRDEIESALVKLWQELLGVERVGVQDNFFELGGYSLIAVRLFSRVKKAWKLEFPLSVLFEAPTVETLAARMREERGEAAPVGAPVTAPKRRKLRHLVPMHGESSHTRTPFFLVAGMYGNVMNLRHLAGHLGADQPVYGIQARGLEGTDDPHQTFEEMATAYIEDMRTVQPHGPYLIGGYSGGGITAYEMAQQLTAAGEEVALLVLLDTPALKEPPLTLPKRLSLARQRIAQQGAGFFTEAIRRKLDDRRRAMQLLVNKQVARLNPGEHRRERIEAAFYNALDSYQLRPWSGRVVLFRPPQVEAFRLAPDHVVNAEGSWVEPLNGWRPWIQGDIDLQIVPGDHDNMVLEPHVRVLAARMRAALDAAVIASGQSATQAAGERR